VPLNQPTSMGVNGTNATCCCRH